MNEHALVEALERRHDSRVIERLEGAASRQEALVERLKTATVLLGKVITARAGETGFPTVDGVLASAPVRKWWRENRSWFFQLTNQDRPSETRRKRIAREALKKLTPKERAALGLPASGKRV